MLGLVVGYSVEESGFFFFSYFFFSSYFFFLFRTFENRSFFGYFLAGKKRSNSGNTCRNPKQLTFILYLRSTNLSSDALFLFQDPMYSFLLQVPWIIWGTSCYDTTTTISCFTWVKMMVHVWHATWNTWKIRGTVTSVTFAWFSPTLECCHEIVNFFPSCFPVIVFNKVQNLTFESYTFWVTPVFAQTLVKIITQANSFGLPFKIWYITIFQLVNTWSDWIMNTWSIKFCFIPKFFSCWSFNYFINIT